MSVITFPPSNVEVVATKTALKQINPATRQFVYLLQAGVMGSFIWASGNYAAACTADTREAVYIAADSVSTSSGAWVRQRDPRTLQIEWFEVFSGAVDNSAAVTAAIALSKFEAGGTIFVGGYYRVDSGIIHDGNDIKFQGRDRSSGFYTTTAGKQFWKVTGSRHAMQNILLVYQAFTATNTDYCLWIYNAVQFSMQDCIVMGAYYNIVTSGTACADNTYVNCDFIYPTGLAINYMVMGNVSGVNGAHHFIRCRFNTPYPSTVPYSSAPFKTWTATTAYSVGDIVTVTGGGSNYYIQCIQAGTSGSVAPTVSVWYGVNITDGSVIWQLTANTGLVGVNIDTGVSNVYINYCDITGPFVSGFVTNNSASGTEPRAIYLNTNTVHGPLNNGVNFTQGDNLSVFQLDTFGSIFKTGGNSTNGIAVGASCTDTKIIGNTCQGFDNGIIVSGKHTRIAENTTAGCTRGIHVTANTTDFGIVGNSAAGTALYGYNTTAIVVAAGTSNNYQITNNNVAGAGTGVTDGGTGLNKTVGSNN